MGEGVWVFVPMTPSTRSFLQSTFLALPGGRPMWLSAPRVQSLPWPSPPGPGMVTDGLLGSARAWWVSARHLCSVSSGRGEHRWEESPFPAGTRMATESGRRTPDRRCPSSRSFAEAKATAEALTCCRTSQPLWTQSQKRPEMPRDPVPPFRDEESRE